MTGLRFEDVQKVAQEGAGLLFHGAVRRLYRTLTGDEPRGDTLRLLERLFSDDRLTPDAALYLMSIARALGAGGRTDLLGLPREWRDRIETLGIRFATNILRTTNDRV